MAATESVRFESLDLSVESLFKDFYRQSSFLLTRSLVEKPTVGVNTRLNRAVKELTPFEMWNSTSIEARQKLLGKLARLVWAMPSKG